MISYEIPAILDNSASALVGIKDEKL